MFVTRVLTAVVLLAGFLAGLLLLGRDQFAIVVAVIVAIGGYEWAVLDRTPRAMAGAYGVLCALLFAANFQFLPLVPWICGLAAAFWAVAVPFWLWRGFDACPRSLLPAVGVVVLVPAGLAMATLGAPHVLMVLGLVWVADSAAYLTGRAFGKRKLAPAISPGKTWEGVAGALVASVIYAIIWAQFDPELVVLAAGAAWALYLAGAVLLCAVGIVGDLFESAAKRRAGVKDSGSLLPGHGGVLDRVDSATATLPVALLLMQAIGA